MINKFSLLLVTFFVFSCILGTQKIVFFSQNRIESHKIKNQIILKPLKKYISENVSTNQLLDVVLLRIYQVDNNKYDIYVTSDYFQTYAVYQRMNKNIPKPKGYFRLGGNLVVLYGDINIFFEKTSEPKDIFKQNENDDILLETHISYKHYRYRKEQLFGISDEYIELVGELDEINGW